MRTSFTVYIYIYIKEKFIEIKIFKEKDNITYNTSEWQKVFQEKIFTP
jgi:hypothetical protein